MDFRHICLTSAFLLSVSIVLAGDKEEAPRPVEGPQVAKVEQQLKQAWDAQRSLLARLRTSEQLVMTRLATNASGSGSLEVLKRGSETLYRMELHIVREHDGTNNDVTMESDQVFFGDGEFTFMINESTAISGGQATSNTLASKDHFNPYVFGGPDVIDYLRADHMLRVLPPEPTDAGKDLVVVEARAKVKPRGSGAAAGSRHYFDPALGFRVRLEEFNRDDRVLRTLALERVKTGAAIPPDRFKFELPPNVKLLDMIAHRAAQSGTATQPAEQRRGK